MILRRWSDVEICYVRRFVIEAIPDYAGVNIA